jgi:GNAT superfamily N-acetyltransferase
MTQDPMSPDKPMLSSGYSDVPPGKIATVVTCLQMLERPEPGSMPPAGSLSVEHWPSPSIGDYRALYRAVGEHWMWTSRLIIDDSELAAILQDPLVEVHALMDADRAVGLLELDFRKGGECEIGYFGLAAGAIGKGAGRFLMNAAIEKAWSRPISRLWVHTCHLDSAQALPFYQRSGFKPFKMMVEVVDDVRLTGLVPRSASPQAPIIEP